MWSGVYTTQWYLVDPTWDDPYPEGSLSVDYTYYMKTSFSDHTNPVDQPDRSASGGGVATWRGFIAGDGAW